MVFGPYEDWWSKNKTDIYIRNLHHHAPKNCMHAHTNTQTLLEKQVIQWSLHISWPNKIHSHAFLLVDIRVKHSNIKTMYERVAVYETARNTTPGNPPLSGRSFPVWPFLHNMSVCLFPHLSLSFHSRFLCPKAHTHWENTMVCVRICRHVKNTHRLAFTFASKLT